MSEAYNLCHDSDFYPQAAVITQWAIEPSIEGLQAATPHTASGQRLPVS